MSVFSQWSPEEVSGIRTVRAVPDGEPLRYLREATNCFIMGLPLAAVALCRVAVDTAFRSAWEKLYGKQEVDGQCLERLIADYGVRLLGQGAAADAEFVRKQGNQVMHPKGSAAPDEKTCLEVLG